MAAVQYEGFEGYRVIAPPGWEPLRPQDDLDGLRVSLASPDTFCLFAETPDGASAGHVAFLPAAVSHRPEPDPQLAHLWQLFVRPPFWGQGVALALHDAALAEATARGFARMRLNTPLDQARARRFYEREGWVLAGEIDDHGFGLRMVEYRRALGG
jgi:GNAT superfamily N-acetyltransferase